MMQLSEATHFVSFDVPLIMPKRLISIPHAPGLESMRCSAIQGIASSICITLILPAER